MRDSKACTQLALALLTFPHLLRLWFARGTHQLPLGVGPVAEIQTHLAQAKVAPVCAHCGQAGSHWAAGLFADASQQQPATAWAGTCQHACATGAAGAATGAERLPAGERPVAMVCSSSTLQLQTACWQQGREAPATVGRETRSPCHCQLLRPPSWPTWQGTAHPQSTAPVQQAVCDSGGCQHVLCSPLKAGVDAEDRQQLHRRKAHDAGDGAKLNRHIAAGRGGAAGE